MGRPPGDDRAFVWTRLLAPEGASRAPVQRAGWFTPELADAIAEEALRAGAGARLEVTLAPDASDTELARVHERFGSLALLGVRVRVGRDDQPGARRFYPSPAPLID